MKNENREANKAEIKELINAEDENFDSKVDESVRNENRKLYALIFIIVFGILAVLMLGGILSIYNAASQVNEYFGYAVLGVMLILMFLLLGIPSIKIFFLPYYSLGKDGKPSAVKRANNNRIIKKVSTNLVAYHGKEQGGYVNEENIQKLATALYKGKNVDIHNALKEVYDTDVNRKVRSLILKSACKSFCYTAVSQNDKIDAISVLFINIRMIKSILYAYGTRPSMYKLVKIYLRVIIGSLVAYGMQNVSVSNILTKFVKATANMVPAVGMLIDSAVQGATSAILTLIIGYKTKAYVYGEFNMAVKDEYEYNASQIADRELAQAIGEYNQSKDLLQEKATTAKKSIEETKKTYPGIVTVKQEEIAPDLTPAQRKVKELAESKEKELADRDLKLLMTTGKKMKNNSSKKKELNGIKGNRPKDIFNWTLGKRKLEEPEDEVATDEVEIKSVDIPKNKKDVPLVPEDEELPPEIPKKRRRKSK